MGLFGPNVEKLKAKRDVPALAKVLVGRQNDRLVRMAAADALGEIGDMRGFLGLEATIGDADQGVRQAVARAILKVTTGDLTGASPSPASQTTTSCKAYENGQCVVVGRDTGPCSWNPERWETCNVVIENRKVHGT